MTLRALAVVVLQSNQDKILDGDWLDGIISVFTDLMGGVWVAMVVLGMMGVLYISTKDIVLPAVVAMLVGGLVVGYGSPVLSSIGMLIMLLGAVLAAGRMWLSGGDAGR